MSQASAVPAAPQEQAAAASQDQAATVAASTAASHDQAASVPAAPQVQAAPTLAASTAVASEEPNHADVETNRFEEDVEAGADRWSKPHVGTISMHSVKEIEAHIKVLLC